MLAKEILPISEYEIVEGVFEKSTLFVAGEKSNYIMPEYGTKMKDKFPNYKLESIDGAGHWVHAEKMVEFSKVIWQFLMK